MEFRRPFAGDPIPLETLLLDIPWIPANAGVTWHRYQAVCAETWQEQRWPERTQEVWQGLDDLATEARGNESFAWWCLKALGYYVADMREEELHALADHLGRLAEELPPSCSTWLEIQSWRAFLLSDLLHWEQAIPLLEEIEVSLNQQEGEGPLALQPAIAHVDCSASYLILGIRERAMDHLARAEEDFYRTPFNEDSLYVFSHLVQNWVQLLGVQEDHEEMVSMLERVRRFELYDQLPEKLRAAFDFRHELALCWLGNDREVEMRRAYQRLTELLDYSDGSEEVGDEDYRASTFLNLSSYYIHFNRIAEARGLHKWAENVSGLREYIELLGESPTYTDANQHIVTSFVLHLVAVLGEEPIPAPLREWIKVAFDKRLNAISSAPPLALGVGRDAYADLSSLAECMVLCAQQENPGPVGDANALEALLRCEVGGTLARYLGAIDTNLASIQTELLAPNTGIYAILVGWQYTHVFLIDRSGVSLHRLGSASEFSLRSRRLERELRLAQNSQPHRERLDRAIASMQDFLLPPTLASKMEQGAWREIAFSGFEGVSYVPMDLLQLPDGERMGDRMPTTYYPSITAAMALSTNRATRRAKSTDHWLSLIATDAPSAMSATERGRLLRRSADMQPLPFTSEDRSDLFGNFPPSIHLEFFQGSDVSAQTLLGSETNALDAIFIMGHGCRDDDLAASPGLLLRSNAGGTTVLGPTDLDDFQAPPLVMLIACGTTDAVDRFGDDGAQHLVGSLLRRGSDTVLSAHLPLRYEESKRLSAGLLEGLTRRGLSPAQALWQARLKLGDKAGFPGRYLVHVHGLADRPLRAPEPTHKSPAHAWVYALLLIVPLGAIIARSRRAA